MRRAVYYPHTQIRNENFLKTSLLLWDQVDFVSPVKKFCFDEAPRIELEALDLLCHAHVPSQQEKELVHARVVELLRRPLPGWLVTTQVPESVVTGRKIREFATGYGMYPEKLDYKTWRLLEAASLVRLQGPDEDYYARPLIGFLLMSLLADACAGDAKGKITDRSDAYEFMGKMVAAERPNPPTNIDSGQLSAAQAGLVSLAVNTVRTDGIPLENIVAMRKREEGSAGHHYRKFRQNFAAKIEASTERALAAPTPEARRDIAADFEREMRDDLAFLKEELGMAMREVLFSKEMVALYGLGSLAGDVGAWVGAGVGAVQATGKFSKAYAETLGKHAISYLYVGEHPTLRNIPFGPLA